MTAPTNGDHNLLRHVKDDAPRQLLALKRKRAALVAELRGLSAEINEMELVALAAGVDLQEAGQ